MPDTPTSRAPGRRHSEITLTVSLVLAGVVAILILVGSVFFQSDQKGARSRRQLAIPKLLRLRLFDNDGRQLRPATLVCEWCPSPLGVGVVAR
jgi:hypothetical protein